MVAVRREVRMRRRMRGRGCVGGWLRGVVSGWAGSGEGCVVVLCRRRLVGGGKRGRVSDV